VLHFKESGIAMRNTVVLEHGVIYLRGCVALSVRMKRNGNGHENAYGSKWWICNEWMSQNYHVRLLLACCAMNMERYLRYREYITVAEARFRANELSEMKCSAFSALGIVVVGFAQGGRELGAS